MCATDPSDGLKHPDSASAAAALGNTSDSRFFSQLVRNMTKFLSLALARDLTATPLTCSTTPHMFLRVPEVGSSA